MNKMSSVENRESGKKMCNIFIRQNPSIVCHFHFHNIYKNANFFKNTVLNNLFDDEYFVVSRARINNWVWPKDKYKKITKVIYLFKNMFQMT